MTYDIKKTGKKVFMVGLFGAISAIVGYLQVLPYSPEEAILVTFVIAILRGLEDYIKHRSL